MDRHLVVQSIEMWMYKTKSRSIQNIHSFAYCCSPF